MVAGCSGSPSPRPSSILPTATQSVIGTEELPFAQPSSTPFPEDRREALQAVLDQAVASGVTGVTAAVVSARGFWSGAAGVDGGGHRVVPTSMVAIASVTKTFTAAEVVHLAASGKLDLDAPAS